MNTAKFARTVAALVLGYACASAEAQIFRWELRSSTGPNVQRHAMAYDDAREEVVLFGGETNASSLDETWVWNGAVWVQRVTPGPSARVDHAMAYDEQRGVVVLFGGYTSQTGQYHADTWEWNGQSWAQRVVSGPTARSNHAMCYDSARGVVVMFGGTLNGVRNAETWEWDGQAWTQRLVAGASARFSHAMAYDAARQRCVLFGGFTVNGSYSGETWTWDGQAWTPAATTGPTPRSSHTMAFDPVRLVVLLFGGSNGSWSSDTWSWNGVDWVHDAPSQVPNVLTHPAMVYDAGRGVAAAFGFGMTWELVYCTTPVSVASHPANAAMLPGDVATYTVVANGPVIGYQWRHNQTSLIDGPRVSGSTTPTLQVDPVLPEDEGNYDCIVTGTCNMVTSAAATLVCDPFLVSMPPAESVLVPGLQLSVAGPPGANYTYRWRQNNQNLFNIPGLFSGVTTRTLTLLSADVSLVGEYSVSLANGCGSVVRGFWDVVPAYACVADVNCDFALDGFDVETQEKAVGGDVTDYCQEDPDFNRDMALDGFDVEAVELVVGGGACP